MINYDKYSNVEGIVKQIINFHEFFSNRKISLEDKEKLKKNLDWLDAGLRKDEEFMNTPGGRLYTMLKEDVYSGKYVECCKEKSELLKKVISSNYKVLYSDEVMDNRAFDSLRNSYVQNALRGFRKATINNEDIEYFGPDYMPLIDESINYYKEGIGKQKIYKKSY